MNKKKILVLAVSVALIAILAIGGSLAYFTDTTEAKVNVFTVGNVNIDLTEPAWSDNADHTLMPGTSYDKNPTITVDEKSQDCYVFLKIDMNKYVSLVNLMGVDAYKNNIGGLEGKYPGFIEFVNALAGDNTLKCRLPMSKRPIRSGWMTRAVVSIGSRR